MAPEVAIFVQKRYAKATYSVESYSVRRWYGVEMLRDALERAGIEVGYCSSANVGQFKVVLVSLTAAGDYYTFMAERETWAKGSYSVLVGGAGLLNVQPLVWSGDTFCFGRSEVYIVPLVKAALAGERLEHPSVCYADEFDPRKQWTIQQAAECYPHEVTISDGQKWKEAAIGCKRRCLFCGFTWHRKSIIPKTEHDGNFLLVGVYGQETTIHDLCEMPVDQWSKRLQIGLDGLSERLRFGVGKKITNDMWYHIVRSSIERAEKGWIRVYNLVGLPSETEEDLLECIDVAERASNDAKPQPEGEYSAIMLHSTPFKPVPATPAACWPVAKKELRFWTSLTAQRLRNGRSYHNRFSLFTAPNLRFFGGTKEEGLSQIVLEMVIARTTVAESDRVRAIARTPKFWAANAAGKLSTLEKTFDVDRLLGEQDPSTYACSYLRAWARHEKLHQDWRVTMKVSDGRKG
jgi:hypothetical protein